MVHMIFFRLRVWIKRTALERVRDTAHDIAMRAMGFIKDLLLQRLVG